MESLYKKIPTNMRLLGEYLAGNTSTITENDFTPQEINEIRDRVYATKERNSIREEALKAQLSGHIKDVNENGPNGVYGWKDGKFTSPEEYLKELSDKVASFGNTRGKTSVGYNRDESGSPLQDAGVMDILSASMKAPYNIETTLGRFNAYDTPEGNLRIEDTYNWSKPRKPISNSDFIKYGIENIFAPEQLGNLIARKFAPSGKERKVNFEIKGK